MENQPERPVYVGTTKNGGPKIPNQQREPGNHSKHLVGPGPATFRLFSLPPMNTSPDNQPSLDGQHERAATAHLNPNDPAHEADAGTPAYGDFGKATATAGQQPTAGRDGSNDNPDEFSELRKPEDTQKAPTNPTDQRGHVTQNQDPAAVNAVQNAETDKQRAAWSDDDPRYAGGKPKATWAENNDQEHTNN